MATFVPSSAAHPFIAQGLHPGPAVQEIAETKMPDLNATTVEAGMKIIEGTAKNMGITVEA